MKKVIEFLVNLPVAIVIISSYLLTSALLRDDAKELILLWVLLIGFLLGYLHGKKIR